MFYRGPQDRGGRKQARKGRAKNRQPRVGGKGGSGEKTKEKGAELKGIPTKKKRRFCAGPKKRGRSCSMRNPNRKRVGPSQKGGGSFIQLSIKKGKGG